MEKDIKTLLILNNYMNIIRDLQKELPSKTFKPITTLDEKRYGIVTNLCIKNNNLIMYYLINKKNSLIKKMILYGAISPDVDTIIFHKDNYVSVASSAYKLDYTIDWIIKSLIKDESFCSYCGKNLENHQNIQSCIKCNSGVCITCYMRVVDRHKVYVCGECGSDYPVKEIVPCGVADDRENVMKMDLTNSNWSVEEINK